MCGIVGYISKTSYKDSLDNNLDLINHRGPDGRGKYEDYTEELNVALGHTRLSIIDLSENADQPFISECKRYVLVFNGEIYNYKELKAKYLKDSNLNTSSDTEVLLHLLILKNVEILNELNGMFSFVFYDREKQDILICRDQLGIKPLYIIQDDEKLLFSSEIKALWAFKDVEKQIDKNSYFEFLLNGFIYEPDTGFTGVKKLMPGSYITIDKTFKINQERYWTILPKENSDTNKIKDIENTIQKSIHEHLESDVPVGLFFSGGVDSTIILDEVKNKIQPIIVKSSKEETNDSGSSNDYYYANEIAKFLNVDLKSIMLSDDISTNEQFLKEVDYLSQATEEPISDFTFISSRAISKKSKELGYSVMLSGMGADEIFGGYPRYKMVKYEKLFAVINKLVPDFVLRNKTFEKKLQRFRNYFREDSFALKYASLVGYFSKKELNNLCINRGSNDNYLNKISSLLADIPNSSNLKKAMYLDLFGFLSHNFLVADKSSMLESLELRVPLATKELAEKTIKIKSSSLLKFSNTKIILKEILLKNKYPKSVIYRKKAGFNPPLDGYIRRLGKSTILEVLDNNQFFKEFNIQPITSILDNHFKNLENNTYKIFQLLYFSYWIKNNSNNI